MSTDIAKREEQTALSKFSPSQVALIKSTIAPGASDDELELFAYQCKRTGLDPFSKQIYSIERRSKDADGNWITTRQTQIAIDGARLIAERVNQRRPGAYRPGPVEWVAGEAQRWLDTWTSDAPPAAARATVYKDGEPVMVVANYNEFVQRTSGGNPVRQWKAMPAHMLGKCAEMLALRRAFPQELSGLVIEEEPPLAGPKESDVVIEEELATDEQLAAIADGLATWMAGSQDKREQLDDRLRELYPEVGAEVTITKLTRRHADDLIDKLNQHEEATA